jgi:hypothetical protein
MSQPNTRHLRKLRTQGVLPADVNKLLEALRILDRSVVEISMRIYKVPRRHRAVMRKQHRILHDTIRRRLPQFLSTTRNAS